MSSKVKTRKQFYPINLKRSKIVIALAQINGNGKHRSVIDDRETLAWISKDDMNARINKACGIIDALNKSHAMKADIIVFPEYSLPVEKALSKLQERADKYNQIIIAGADNIKNGSAIYNKAPILIPHKKKPLWITKREISKWEEGLVDTPKQITLPILTWSVGERSYWLSIYICLDFELAPQEIKKGGGVAIVTMSSPEIIPFRGWADSLLRLEGGTATILCNCVGEGARGESGVIAVSPDAGSFKSAFELSNSEEGVGLFELDLHNLSQPKPTVPSIRPPLGKRYIFALQFAPEGVELIPLRSEEQQVVKRGIINPAIFDLLGKNMRLAFLSVPDYAEVAEKVRTQDFEVLAILGQHDLLITHLSAYRYDMIYDIRQILHWKKNSEVEAKSNEDHANKEPDELPFFKVEHYFKVLGFPISKEDHSVFDNQNSVVPTVEEITQIMRLGSNWDEDVPDEARDKFLQNKWILGNTEKLPGNINAIMTVYLEHAGVDRDPQQRAFEASAIPWMNRNNKVTSIYRGISRGLAIDYVLRLSVQLDELYPLIEAIHKLARKARVLISTTTYVVVQSLSSLSLEKAVLVTDLPGVEARYRNKFIYPHLSPDEKFRLMYLSGKDQQEYIERFRTIREALIRLRKFEWFKQREDEIERSLASGLLSKDFLLSREVHDPLHVRLEKFLTDFISSEITDRELSALRSAAGIQSQKSKTELSYTDKVKLMHSYFEKQKSYPHMLEHIKRLSGTTKARNAFMHDGDWIKITIDDYALVLPIYVDFLISWEDYLKRKSSPSESAG